MTVSEVFDRMMSTLLGTEQKRVVERVRDHWAKDEESASLFNQILDHLEQAGKDQR